MKNTGSKQAEKKIRKYLIGKNSYWNVLAWLLAAGTLALLSMCTVFAKKDVDSDAMRFDPVNSGYKDYVYLDIYGISDWMYKYIKDGVTDYYYTAGNADGDLYIITMKQADYDQLKAQYDWWYNDAEGPAPQPARVYGGVSKLTDENITDFADFYGMSEEQFKYVFGTKYMEVGSSPAGERNSAFGYFAFTMGFIWFLTALLALSLNTGMKRSIKAIRKRGELERAAEELEAPESTRIGPDSARATEHYLFGHGTGYALRLEDILWFYTRNYYSGSMAGSYIIANTSDRRNVSIINLGSGPDAPLLYEQVRSIITAHNPDVIIGKSGENKKKYKELVKSIKNVNK